MLLSTAVSLIIYFYCNFISSVHLVWLVPVQHLHVQDEVTELSLLFPHRHFGLCLLQSQPQPINFGVLCFQFPPLQSVFVWLCWIFSFETKISQYIPSLEVKILLPLPPQSWEHRRVPSHLALRLSECFLCLL